MASKKSKNKNKKEKNERPEKRPIVERYDEDGNRIGDDGFVMTKARKRMHRMLDAYFIWGIIAAIAAVALIVLSYFQGAQYGDWELVQRGGNQFHGWDTATLMRLDSVYGLLSGVFAVVLSFLGFRWFYDDSSERRFRTALYIYVAIAAVVLIAFVALVQAPELFSIINLVFVALTYYAMREVKFERPKLKKAKVAKTVTKK
jgi:magnesium-transporting ATPase (P-type)